MNFNGAVMIVLGKYFH